MQMQQQEICCAQTTSRTEGFYPAPLSRKLGGFSTHTPCFLVLYTIFAAGQWLNRANIPAIKYTNHSACASAKPAISLLQCLHSRPVTSSHGSRPQWSQIGTNENKSSLILAPKLQKLNWALVAGISPTCSACN